MLDFVDATTSMVHIFQDDFGFFLLLAPIRLVKAGANFVFLPLAWKFLLPLIDLIFFFYFSHSKLFRDCLVALYSVVSIHSATCQVLSEVFLLCPHLASNQLRIVAVFTCSVNENISLMLSRIKRDIVESKWCNKLTYIIPQLSLHSGTKPVTPL